VAVAPLEVEQFDRRADSYDEGRPGERHRLVAERSAAAALSAMSLPARVLDVGCGTGMLLRDLAARLPGSVELIGVDPAPGCQKARTANGDEERVRYEQATAEWLPFEAASFDLVVSTLSFDHWCNQRAGLLECARVLREDGRLVVADLFAAWLWPTTVLARRDRARTVSQATRLLTNVGFQSVSWQRVFSLAPFPLVRAAVATRSPETAATCRCGR
jgi:ubiquinone/menaquinone biosynthesis C-methylase UbiE